MVTPNDTTTPAQTAAPRLDGGISARLTRPSLRSRINPAAFAPPRTGLAARAACTPPAPLSSDARHDTGARTVA